MPAFVPGLPASRADAALCATAREFRAVEGHLVLWFADVFRRQVYSDLGFGSIYVYASRRLGFSRAKTAQYVRLSRVLGGLPELRRALSQGDLSWTKARVVARVATTATERTWIDLAKQGGRRELERRAKAARLNMNRARSSQAVISLGAASAGNLSASPEAARRGKITGADGAREPATTAGCNGAATFPEGAAHPATIPEAVAHPATNPEAVAHPGTGGQGDVLVGSDPSGGTPTMNGATRGSGPDAQRDVLQDLQTGRHHLAGTDRPPDLEVPVQVSVRFSPEQYARYEALLEAARKRGARASREELLLKALSGLVEALADDRRGPGSASRGEAGGQKQTGTRVQGEHGYRRAGNASPAEGTRSDRSRAAPLYQVVVGLCESCGAGSVVTSRGARALGESTLRAILCDSRVHRRGARNRATIPPSVRRAVLDRDRHRCRMPGCGSAHFLQVHHLVPREAGGSNQPDNLVTLCSGCHRALHRTGENRLTQVFLAERARRTRPPEKATMVG